jgi:hypothetical protein
LLSPGLHLLNLTADFFSSCLGFLFAVFFECTLEVMVGDALLGFAMA